MSGGGGGGGINSTMLENIDPSSELNINQVYVQLNACFFSPGMLPLMEKNVCMDWILYKKWLFAILSKIIINSSTQKNKKFFFYFFEILSPHFFFLSHRLLLLLPFLFFLFPPSPSLYLSLSLHLSHLYDITTNPLHFSPRGKYLPLPPPPSITLIFLGL